jgi:flagellar motor component MotA
MKRKVTNVLLFLAIVLAAIALTVVVGQDAYSVMIYNFVFLGIMVVLFLAGMFGGMFRVENLAKAFRRAEKKIEEEFTGGTRADKTKLLKLEGVFEHEYLDARMSDFLQAASSSPEGIAEIEEYLNEDEIEVHIHKRLLEMIPDILTSLGILGTFVGLVWGLKNFEPSNYEAMTNSVAALVEGIKVAFLTSIYGISLSIVYSYGMRSSLSALSEDLQTFMGKFHASVLPTAENESRNLMAERSRQQIEMMGDMSDKMAKEMADRFAETIMPVFEQMNTSMNELAGSMTGYQEEALKNIVQGFLREMNRSFRSQFADFNDALKEMKRVQTEQSEFTENLYKNLSKELSDTFLKQDASMKRSVRDLISAMESYMRTANEVTADNLEVQKQQRVDYEHILSYMKEAEKSSAEFWIACNQTMQKYVELCSASTEKVGNAGKVSAAVIRENRALLKTLDERIQSYAAAEAEASKVMKELTRLLGEMSAERSGNEIYLRGSASSMGNRDVDRLSRIIEEQGERQEELLKELVENVQTLTNAAKKSKFKLFK